MSKAEQLYKNDDLKTAISPIIDNPNESLVDNTVNGSKLIDDSVNINKLNPSTRKIINDSYTEVGKKQDKLDLTQLAAVNSGIIRSKVTKYDNYESSKQDKLVSGINIKSINGQTLLGSGNIVISSTGASGVQLSTPASATNGTLSSGQLATLQESDSNYIIFNNELYRLQDKAHTGDTWTYAHIGYENNVHWVKTISITISTLAWVLNKVSIGGTQPQPPKDELIGTWVFKELINLSYFYGNHKKFIITFISNNENFSYIDGNTTTLEGTKFYYNNTNVYISSKDFGSSWTNQAYRTIEITDVSQLTNREEFINFMKANATKQ